MKAAVIYGPGDIKVIEKDTPTPKEGEVLIRIHACGVCGTDHSLYVGGFPASFPVVIGHEFAGEVVALGAGVTTLQVGDRVTVDPNRVCHKCDYCRMGKEHLCANRLSMGVEIDGADAEYCAIGESNVYRLPDHVTYEQAAFCEPLACAVHGMDLARVNHGDTVLILGAGGMGNLLTQLAALRGAVNIIVSEPIKKRREVALKNGATHVIDPSVQNVDAELRKICQIGADVVIEAAGSLSLQAQSIYYSRKGGTIVWFGCSPMDKTVLVNSYDINDRELTLLGSFNNQFATARAVELLGSQKIRVDNLISHRLPLAAYLDVFKIFGGVDTLKLMVLTD
jgi:2-desacetyl-2-hydroxyethyl bacteriochlorophyllide A dehydrogenase